MAVSRALCSMYTYIHINVCVHVGVKMVDASSFARQCDTMQCRVGRAVNADRLRVGIIHSFNLLLLQAEGNIYEVYANI